MRRSDRRYASARMRSARGLASGFQPTQRAPGIVSASFAAKSASASSTLAPPYRNSTCATACRSATEKTVAAISNAASELQEQLARESSVEWVIVRPSSLTDGAARGAFRVSLTDERVPGRIERADVAALLVDQLTTDEYLCKAPVIGG